MANNGKKSKSEDRSLYWAFIMYPGDSAPENWLDLLRSTHVNMFVSPEHQPGKSDPENGEPEGTEKKLHRHVILYFDSTKSQGQAQEIADLVHGSRAFSVWSKSGYTRYLCHLDNPEKEKLDPEDVIAIGPIIYDDNIAEKINRPLVLKQMKDWCKANVCFSFQQLCDYADENNETWSRALTDSCTYYMKEYLQSFYWTAKNKPELLALGKVVKEIQDVEKQSCGNPEESELVTDETS